MIRVTALAAPRLTGTTPPIHLSHCQRRWRAFIRRVDKKGEVYFQPTKKGNDDASTDGEPRIVSDLFEMPDLLLDLDAEDSPVARPMAEADEERMREEWARGPRRAAVRERVRYFESEIGRAREGKTRMGRPSQHDILSSALLGSPGTIEARGAVTGDATANGGVGGLQQQLASIRDTCEKNRIPDHAAKSDAPFLEWLLLRHGKIGQPMLPSTAEDVAAALREQTSVQGIRHVVFQCLADIDNVAHYANYLGFSSVKSPSIPHEIRAACVRVCEGEAAAGEDRWAGAWAEVAALVGNLAQRFWGRDVRLGAVMCALGLRAAAEMGSLTGCSLWIARGRLHGLWKYGEQSAADVLGALHVWLEKLRLGSSASISSSSSDATTAIGMESTRLLSSHAERQDLLRIMTGVDDNGTLTPDSFRDMSARFLKEEEDPLPEAQVYAIYEAYVRILGELGAVRTLHFEAVVSSRWAKQKLEGSWTVAGGSGAVDGLFHEAMLRALRVAPVVVGNDRTQQQQQQQQQQQENRQENQQNHQENCQQHRHQQEAYSMTLEECAAQDLRSIEEQKPEAWGYEEEFRDDAGRSTGTSSQRGILTLSRNISFEEWLAQVEEILGGGRA